MMMFPLTVIERWISSGKLFKQWIDEKHTSMYHCPWCKERSFKTIKADQKDAEGD